MTKTQLIILSICEEMNMDDISIDVMNIQNHTKKYLIDFIPIIIVPDHKTTQNVHQIFVLDFHNHPISYRPL